MLRKGRQLPPTGPVSEDHAVADAADNSDPAVPSHGLKLVRPSLYSYRGIH